LQPIWRFFSSVKLAITLLILLALALVIGTLIPQGEPSAFYASHYGRLAGLLSALRLTNLYGSAWYLTLLLLFAVNTIVCTLSRFPAKWRRAFGPRVDTEPSALVSLKVKARFVKNASSPDLRSQAESLLSARRYKTKTSQKEGRLCLLAGKRRLGHFGSDIVHLGLLVVMAGGIVSGLAGFRTQLTLGEGQTAAVPGAAFEIRLDKFETEFYPQGSVKAWKSTVTVIENGAPVLSRTISVNKPLSHGRYSFYQTSYGWNWDTPTLVITVKKKSDPGASRTVRLKVGERVAVDEKGVDAILVKRFVPDFVIGEGNETQSRSEQPNNPAALVEGWKGGERIFSGWVFAKYPDFDAMHSGQPTDLVFNLTDFQGSELSVLEAARDPGVGLIWAGCLFVTAGFFLAFYWPPREIRMVFDAGRDRTEVTAGGQAAKNREAFQAEFEAILNSLRRGS
jgi:cytochrome c biogenesis protein